MIFTIPSIEFNSGIGNGIFSRSGKSNTSTVKAFVVTPKMTKNSIIFRGDYYKGYKFFIADVILFIRTLNYLLDY